MSKIVSVCVDMCLHTCNFMDGFHLHSFCLPTVQNVNRKISNIEWNQNITWFTKVHCFSLQACFAALLASCHAGLLGAGTGEGSCAAAPFRANPSALKYTVCPQYASCCSEFGYCRPKSEWDLGVFR